MRTPPYTVRRTAAAAPEYSCIIEFACDLDARFLLLLFVCFVYSNMYGRIRFSDNDSARVAFLLRGETQTHAPWLFAEIKYSVL